jgi:hypothetical protein
MGFGLGACCPLGLSAGAIVNVTNDGPTPVSNLRVSFKGGEKSLAKLDPGRAQMFRVKPSGESDVTLRFVDALGDAHSHNVDVYLEKNYRGTIDVKIDRFGKITWQDKITPCPN